MGLLRGPSQLPHDGGDGRQAATYGQETRQLWVRQARRDGNEVVTMRCRTGGGQYVIECDVYPVDGPRVEPRAAGPYVFTSERDANGFADEATLALQYLGCEIVDPTAA